MGIETAARGVKGPPSGMAFKDVFAPAYAARISIPVDPATVRDRDRNVTCLNRRNWHCLRAGGHHATSGEK